MYIAHTKNGKDFVSEDECQELIKHLNNTAYCAKERANVFGAGKAAELIGLLHDIGKYSEAFQKRIRGKNISAPHSMAGACIINSTYDALTKLYGIVICSHHTGLCNYGVKSGRDNSTYLGKLSNYEMIPLPYDSEIIFPDKITHKSLKLQKDYVAFQVATYLRILFSVLVDSDFTDTEEFCTDISREPILLQSNVLFDKLIRNMPQNNDSEINKIRAGIFGNCLMAAEKPQGLFSLTVPTGGGKTLSSLAFALKHAEEHGLRRIIYVIPYTSIIEQNAEVIKKIFGDGNVLEHHSGFDIDEDDKRTKWASENWDIPIVVTTNVQFFESLFANKTTKSRKIHNIANSVVIFDEAQMLPVDYLSPCMAAISEMILNYGVTTVLCSATQPLVQKYGYKELEFTEIASNPDDLAEQHKRVVYSFVGSKTDGEIVQELTKRDSALIILNSRKHAFALYELVKESIFEESLFYLSTLLTPHDRTNKIKTIKKRLNEKLPVVVISTQLIEAGVDVDFPVVYRSIAGIDSIIQAGGRANREGKLNSLGEVIVFES
ncbi:MAG: CRISPR-associated helicase Cas3', partial [Chitinispirillales bacterium]|nr:CRISPR-associated helicase Cas3' [Chitinispirillales bacterium]